MNVRRQLLEGSLPSLLPCGCQGLNSGHRGLFDLASPPAMLYLEKHSKEILSTWLFLSHSKWVFSVVLSFQLLVQTERKLSMGLE